MLALVRQVVRVAVPHLHMEPEPSVFSWHPALPGDEAMVAQQVLRAVQALPDDPLGEVFGQFDGHGWNMAFQDGQLTGIHDFGDAGIGPWHRDLVQASFIFHDLVRHMLPTYGQRTGLMPDARRVSLLTGWHSLWELVTADPGGRRVALMQYRRWLADGSAEAIA